MRDIFFQSLMAEPPVICGRKLLPFSLAHEYILKSTENPYVVGGKIDRAAFLFAVDVCARTWEENRAMLGLGYVPQIGVWRKFSRKWKRFDYASAHRSMQAYLQNFNDHPEHWEPEESPGEGLRGSPEFHLAYILMRYFRFTESQAWNCPIGRARAYYSTHSEANGDKTLKSQFEDSLIEKMNQEPDAAKETA